MIRREFIKLFGGATLTFSAASFAQDSQRMRKLGILVNLEADDQEGLARIRTFSQELQKHGWIEGTNLHT